MKADRNKSSGVRDVTAAARRTEASFAFPVSRRSRWLTTLLTSAVAAAWMQPATAQSLDMASTGTADASRGTADTQYGGGDIIVTATKRGASSLKDVPIAISAVSAEALTAKGALDFKDFYRQVPGLAIQDYGPGDKRYIIRGVNATGAGTVGLYLDEIIVTGQNGGDGGGQQTDLKLFDIDRVEVLKGPQGTTFGSSSLSGTIRYIATKPSLDEFSAVIRGGPRSTKGAEIGFQVDGGVTIPIIKDRFSVRVSGYYANMPGYIDNIFGKGVNNEISKAARIIAKLAISDDLTLSGTAMIQNTHQDSKGYIYDLDYAGNDLTHLGYFQADASRAPWNDKLKLFNALLEWKRDYGTFTATASRFDRRNEYVVDASLGADAFYGLPFNGAGRSVLFQPTDRVVDNAEVRFASNFKGRFQILVGAFLQDEDRDFKDDWRSANPQGYAFDGSTVLLLDTTATKVRERAVFGEASYEFTDQLKLTAGLRWFQFKQTARTDTFVVNIGPGSGVGVPSSSSEKGVIPRINLAYRASDNVNVYAQVAQGFRSGGVNNSAIAAAIGVIIPDGFGSDKLWNYEAGFKADLFDRKLFVDAAVYYLDWTDIQIKAHSTNGELEFAYTANGGGAHVKGVELQAQFRPSSGLSLNSTLSYSDATLSQDNRGEAGDKGDRIPYVPRWQLSGGADYEFPLDSGGLRGVTGFDVSYVSARATDFNPGVGANYYPLKANTVTNLRIGVKDEGWSLTLIANNLFNNNAAIDYARIVPGLYPAARYILQPRTFALNVTKSF